MHVTGREGLYGCGMLSIPHCVDNRLTDGGQVNRLTDRPLFTRPKYFFYVWYSFPFEAE
jgi:hypothetical protein